jgi:hypothetical protein
MSTSTQVLGIHQSDLIVRSAILKSLAKLRENSFLLDYCFNGLLADSLTAEIYGKEINNVKKWFLETDIPVVVTPRIDEVKLPCITISLISSTEAEATLGDVHYEPTEETSGPRDPLSAPFTPTYDEVNGVITLPEIVTDNMTVYVGMYILDHDGNYHEIIEVIDDSNVKIKTPGVYNFQDSTIRPGPNPFIAHLESVAYKETYQVGCHVQGEPTYLTYLHSIVLFALLTYKEAYLEARGFDRSIFNSTDFVASQGFGVELAFSRYINVTGVVRHYWVKTIMPKITGFSFQPIIADAGKLTFSNAEFKVAPFIGPEDKLVEEDDEEIEPLFP